MEHNILHEVGCERVAEALLRQEYAIQRLEKLVARKNKQLKRLKERTK